MRHLLAVVGWAFALSSGLGASVLKVAYAREYSNTLMLCLVNTERGKQGETFLGMSVELTVSSQRHSNDQAHIKKMSHNGTDGSIPSERITQSGFDWQTVAENVAFGYRDEQTCMSKWMSSDGHRDNILRKGLTHFGSAVAYSTDNIPYYTQNFAGDNKKHAFPRCPGESKTPSYPESGGKPTSPGKRKRVKKPSKASKRKKVSRPRRPAAPPGPARNQTTTRPAKRRRPAPPKSVQQRRPTAPVRSVKRKKTIRVKRPANRTRSARPRKVFRRKKVPNAPAKLPDMPQDWTCIRKDSKGGCVRWKKCTEGASSWSCTEKWGSAP